MTAWFSFKGIRSTAIGVQVIDYPPETIPEERVEFIEVPGRSGSLAIPEGDEDEAVYDDITLSIDCYVPNTANINDVAAWLRGSGELILGNDSGYCYKAHAINQIELKKIVRGKKPRTFSACFRCAPFRYESDPDERRLNGPFVLANPGTVPANPFITVRGSGTVRLTVGDRSVTLDGLAGEVTIDCDAKCAYKVTIDNQVAITLDDQDWPVLGLDDTKISWSGNAEWVKIRPNWRWL